MAVREILLLGDERLYTKSRFMEEDDKNKARQVAQDLHDTMTEFRKKHGFGRAIAAPQIGQSVRLIYLNYDGRVYTFVNPVMDYYDDETFEMWDDCMSFPNLEVKLIRYKKCRMHYKDLNWQDQIIDLSGDMAELLQHEYDHLDGILAVQRAVDLKAFRIRRV